ncbi:alpha/beta hydrolase family protein [Ancylobacter defluvii]|uniref:Dienelactone hydrolase n=1 Tax=Ancylobacter defluvii TaxID=1282440 RepID=A0A9W6JZJ4_9HYPH|nr:hypothetical protein [Ancylobacter defluvii]MBS7587080.1 hypothetical protein [Ancylobacter defluvii]GLK85383.1 hypothetical protein GCM10017653_34530 [Ancylobacter defluvii]
MVAGCNVGFTEGVFADAVRPHWSGGGARPIRWSAWYPTDDAVWEAATMQAADAAGDSVLAPTFRPLPLCRDARLAGRAGALPLVLLSHGTGGTVAGLGWLAHRLAARGLVVAGVDHHGNTAREAYRPEGFLCWWERAGDLTRLADHLLADPRFAGGIDAARLHVAGFSLGGHAALALLGGITEMPRFLGWAAGRPFGRGPREFPDLADRIVPLLAESPAFRASWQRQSLCFRDPRICSALVMAPAPTVRGFTPESLEAIGVPVLLTVGGADREAPGEAGAGWLHGLIPASRLVPLGADVGHYVFLGECTPEACRAEPAICIDAPGIDRAAIHARVAALALDLFAPSGS